MQLKMTVTIKVDLKAWAETYGQNEADARADAQGYLPRVVEEGVNSRLLALSNGAKLVSVALEKDTPPLHIPGAAASIEEH